jgi:nucleotide-binding universal stress UspA family protein
MGVVPDTHAARAEVEMKILIGVDDSAYSNAAVEHVAHGSWPAGTRAIALSIVRPIVGAYLDTYAPSMAIPDDVLREQRDWSQRIASQAATKLKAAGIECEARVMEGDPRDLLVLVAGEEKADLVVVGSHGRSGVRKLLIGSVANHVVTHSPCSVTVVKIAHTAKR